MKAPTDKRNDTIQIIVTTTCDRGRCSNCTQLLPFRRDVRHMSVDVFRRAVESVVDWPGVVGLFGGNPCMHPQFSTLCDIMTELIPDQRRRGIWTNDLLGHGELVRATFFPNGRFNINVHGNSAKAMEVERYVPGKVIPKSRTQSAWHSPVLMHYDDVGLTYEQWVPLREQCDINRNWSAAIAERDGEPFAYFCEVAAALDGVRGVNNGNPVEPGWWKQPISWFDHQIVMCCDHGCGISLRQRGHFDNDHVYDITASWERILRTSERVAIAMHESLPDKGVAETTDYMRLRKGQKA